MNELSLHFNGPFSFTLPEKSVFISPFADNACIYLWTMKVKGLNYIHYIGETTCFAKRQREHLYHILGLNYGIWDAEKVGKGDAAPIWPGLWRVKDKTKINETIFDFYISNNKKIVEYVSSINLFVAKTDVDVRLRKHIEGCIGWNLRKNHSHYKLLYPDDNHIGTNKQRYDRVIQITCDEQIMGLDKEIGY